MRKISKVLRDVQIDERMSVTRSSNGQIWVCKWDKYAGRRGLNVLYREITAADRLEIKEDGLDVSNDSELILWAVNKEENDPSSKNYKKPKWD